MLRPLKRSFSLLPALRAPQHSLICIHLRVKMQPFAMLTNRVQEEK